VNWYFEPFESHVTQSSSVASATSTTEQHQSSILSTGGEGEGGYSSISRNRRRRGNKSSELKSSSSSSSGGGGNVRGDGGGDHVEICGSGDSSISVRGGPGDSSERLKIDHVIGRGDGKSAVEIILGGDLLQASESFVIHQCNCITSGARGVAKALFDLWPAADAYKRRRGVHSVPGTIDWAPVAGGATVVVGLFAQRAPGKARSGNGDDSRSARLRWFIESLAAFTKAVGLSKAAGASQLTVAMPYLIGCGLAGGHWPDYLSAIRTWADRNNAVVRLYDRERQSLTQSSGSSPGKH